MGIAASGGRGWCLGVVLVAACAAPKAPVPAPPARPAATAAAVTPATAASARPLPWIAELQTELESLRGLRFRTPVKYETQKRDAYRRTVHDEIVAELPPGKAADVTRTYVALGLVKEGLNLADALEQALATQVAAYYDPRLKTFRVIDVDNRKSSTDEHHRVASHELAHALQDQHFDLQSFSASVSTSRQVTRDQDEVLARRFVTEGEATFLMLARDLGSGSPGKLRLGPLAVAGLRMNITMLAAADMLELMSNLRQGSGSDELDEQTVAELRVFTKLPPMVTLPMVEPYLKGALFVSEVWASGGWPAVDALYRSPPQSTEQTLHPREKFLTTRELPLRIDAAAIKPPPSLGPGARLLDSDVIGELGWRTYFRTWEQPDGDAAAVGWGGDRYWVWASGPRALAVTATIWDSDADARRFVAAYEATLAARLKNPAIAADGHEGFRVRSQRDGIMVVECRGRRVDIIDGVQEAELGGIQAALRAATFRIAGTEERKGAGR